jgi:pectinesterase
MRRSSLFFCSLFAVIAGCTQQPELTVTVVNPAPFARTQETVSLQWSDVLREAPAMTSAEVSVVGEEGEIPSQLIDTDADGTPEELLFQSAFAPDQQKTFTVRGVAGQSVFPALVDARFVLPREDLAWENDRIAFRIYGSVKAGDVRNGIDVWTKRVRSLIVQKWYKESEGSLPGKDSYHTDRGEGADFFSVGKSLGAGGCGIWKNGAVHQPALFSSHRILANGPIRTMFRVSYDGGTVEGVAFHAEQTVSLDAGRHLNRIEIAYSGPAAGDTLTVAAGLVKRKNVVCTVRSDRGWLALWGPVNDDSTNGSLGTGIVISADAHPLAAEDTVQHLLLAPSRGSQGLTYYAGAAWTRSGDVGRIEDWHGILDQWAAGLRQPLRITLSAAAKK